ncbi:MAG TPA: hypothetical protein VD770_04960 [Coxiellaceae bacterium]|nr:hypothetical protein [Coxiellaceae bacterium]
MILGISFLESWVKFRAPTLSRAIGLDVGRTIFNSFHKVQCILLMLVVCISLFAKIPLMDWLMVGVLTSIILLQLTWLFPILDRQVTVILAEGEARCSHAHKTYGVLEVAKFLALLGFTMRLMF